MDPCIKNIQLRETRSVYLMTANPPGGPPALHPLFVCDNQSSLVAVCLSVSLFLSLSSSLFVPIKHLRMKERFVVICFVSLFVV